MRNKYIPYGTISISLATLLYSMYVALCLTGSLLGNVKITELEPYGGVTFEHLLNLELWRLFASQLIHAKQVHMLYNVFSLAMLGILLERHIGGVKFTLLWFVAGSVGTLVSTFFVTPPWNLGTGASQAILGVAALGIVVVLKRINTSKWLVATLCISLLPAFALDFIYAGYPKPGHIAGLVVGVALSAILIRGSNNTFPTKHYNQ